MQNLHKVANRLSALSIIWGILIAFSGLGGALALSIFTGPFALIAIPLFVLLGIFVIVSGVRIKKNKDSLYNVKGALVFILIISLLALLQSIGRLTNLADSSSGPLMLPLVAILLLFSGFMVFDSIKLLQNSKKPQV